MSRTKALVALFGAALLVCAVGSAAAVAAPAAWMLGGKTLSEEGLREAPVKEVAEVSQKMVMAAGGLTIACAGSIDMKNATISEVSGEGFSASSLEFANCKAEPKSCKVPTTLGTVPLDAEFTLDGSSAIKGVFRPKAGTVFITIAVSGEACGASGSKPVLGAVEVLAPEGQDERTDQRIEATQGLTGLLKFGSGGASLEGAASVLLANARPWSFL